jgi:anthranilate phosphoribosyltransferase
MHFTELLHKLSDRDHLTSEESSFAMREILKGSVPDIQIAAFLFGMRSKGETIDELTAFVSEMRNAAVKLDVDVTNAVDLCGTGGDHSGTFNISTAAMFVVAGAGVPVLKHGNRSISSSSGSFDVLVELGCVPDLPPDKVKECFVETNMAFMFAPLFHPAMKFVMPARRGLGMRTFFNILGPLSNPAGVKRQVIGTFSKSVASDMIRILANLDTDYAITLHAHDGLDEVSLSAITDTFELRKNVSSEAIRFDPTGLGYPMYSTESLKGGDSKTNASIIRDIMSLRATSAQHDIVELNAAFAIYVSGMASDLSEAKEMASFSIRSGKAAQSLELFATCTKSLINN